MNGGRTSCLRVAVLAVVLGAAALRAEVPVVRVETLPASLAGTWELALDDAPGGIAGLDALELRPVTVPGPIAPRDLPEHGTAWYRVVIDLSPELTAVPLAFTCREIRDADEVYLDGLLVGRTGRFPPTYERGAAVDRVYGLPPSRTALSGRHVLAVRVYLGGPRDGGLVVAPAIDAMGAAYHARVVCEGPRDLLAATFLALGLFSLFTSIRDREQPEFLSFFLSSVAAAVLTAAWLSYWSTTGLSLSLLYRIGVAGAFAVPAATLLLFVRFFERTLLPRHRVLLGLLLAGGALSLLWPRVDDLVVAVVVAVIASAAVAVDLLAFLVGAVRRRARYARSILIASALVALLSALEALPLLGLPALVPSPGPLAGLAYFVLLSTFLAAMADRLARLRLLASTDPLTGLANRVVLFDRINLELARSRRHGHPVALAILDLDHFKAFNDRYGHVIGDRLLVGVARALSASIRDTDLAARFGGEEFVVLLPEADATQAVGCLERIRAVVASLRVSGASEGVTISAGTAVFDPAQRASVSVTAWLRQADSALYAAKAAGRNRVKVAEGAPPGSSSASGSLEAIGFIRRGRDPSAGAPAQKGSR